MIRGATCLASTSASIVLASDLASTSRLSLRSISAEAYRLRPRRTPWAVASAPPCRSLLTHTTVLHQHAQLSEKQSQGPDQLPYPPPASSLAKRRKVAVTPTLAKPGPTRDVINESEQQQLAQSQEVQPPAFQADGKNTTVISKQDSKPVSVVLSSGAPLLPDQQPPTSLRARLKGLWQMAKQLFRFYFQGLKQIWKNRNEVVELKRRVRQEGYVLNRADRILIRTHSSDMRKLPLFAAILIILEEILPIVVIYMPSLLPSTCVLPSQLESIYSSAELTKHRVVGELRDATSEVQPILAAAAAEGTDVKVGALNQLSRPTLVKLATLFGLSTSLAPAGILRSRLEAHLRYLREDDELMAQGQGFNAVPQDKIGLVKACEERGLRAIGLSNASQFAALQRWVERSTGSPSPSTTPSTADSGAHLLFLPLALYADEGIAELRLKAEADAQKGIIKRTMEVMSSVMQEDSVAQEQKNKLGQEAEGKGAGAAASFAGRREGKGQTEAKGH
ncbi:hypothetical protein K437DRAFT_91409 [Tilletiaria anomala UBC 951]|uniref:Letm1 RBD domain-containing protein n=1 Tax=Tilletiaria anomala (strain ATCC 24038 / CBS 436.72 / UBC 951) TaxID=1037660 RepID=A0A066WAC7_TILAU|nr:uncharacterized protein K437DRAFT_91409 [Tilletiaria anomala UBC 951]KDN47730.1 hypothetical protein K437DRAFT_91409 [Tilletiaria anomala UBC 951]